MPDINDGLSATGGITKAMIDALNQLEAAVAAQLTNPDGSPSGTAVYMHQPIGHSIDPKMYARPWTPAGFAYSATNDDGSFAPATPAPAAPAAGGPTPAPPGQQAAAVPTTSEAAVALNSAFNTARLVDNMLMVTDKGIARSWPDRTVSIEYFTVLAGMQAEPVPEPSAEIKQRIADAEKVLFTVDAQGNYTGYTPLFVAYRHNQKLLGDARTAYAQGYAAAMASPATAATWPVISSSLQTAVDQAYNDFRDMGAQRVEEAQATLQSIGGSAVAALIAKARKMYDDYQVGLAGAVAQRTPWSYIDPVSWWDHNNDDFGVVRIDASSADYDASGGGGSHSYGNSYYQDTSSSNSGSAGFSMLGFGASANVEHDEQHHGGQQDSGGSGWHYASDTSTTATVSFEYFVASCERPWYLGDLFHIEGWYLSGQKKHAISDGTITGQIDAADRLLPMVPKGFVVVRNVTIEADSFGEVQSDFQSLADQSTQTTDASHTSFGGKVGWFGLGGEFKHENSSDSGAFTSSEDTSSSWSFHRTEHGGKLQMFGSQIAGWIGQIQPASPYRDDPNLGQPAATPTDAAPATPPADAAPAPGTPSTDASPAQPTPVPAGAPV
jgi:hypothetical protein